jgi:glutaminyl-tRNA synthetase
MAQTVVSPLMLESTIRDTLNTSAKRAMAVLEPLKVTISNYPHDGPVELEVADFPGDESLGKHKIIFNKVLYIDAADFKEVRFYFVF